MKPHFLSSLRSGLLTLGLVAGVTAPSLAGPILEPDLSVPANLAAPGITPVRDEWAGGNDRQLQEDWRWRNRDGRW
ncbi:MAG: BA14K family protein, partial [Mesorhizobium sp.]